MSTQWCPYTNKFLTPSDLDEEHVIPRSLGGHDRFTTSVQSSENSALGGKLDAAISSHPIVSSARRHYGLLGHSKKAPPVRWPAYYKNLKGTLDLTGDKFDFITYRGLNPYGINFNQRLTAGSRFFVDIEFDENITLSFGSKIALGAANFFFGDVFRRHGYHDELRCLLNSPAAAEHARRMVKINQGRGFWAVSWPKSHKVSGVLPAWFDAILGQPDKNVVFTLHTTSELILGCSILSGFYRWYFNIAKRPNEFPIGDDFDLGAVVEIDLKSNEFSQSNLRDYLCKWVNIEA